MALPKTSIPKARGFTLLEVLIIIGLIVIVGGLGLIVSMDSYRGFHFHNERDIIVAALEKARSQAINNMCFGGGCTDGKPHGVYFGTTGSYVIFQGASYATRDIALDEVIGQKDVAAVVSGTSEVVFQTLSGNGSVATVTVTDVSGKTFVITVTTEGRIWWTN